MLALCLVRLRVCVGLITSVLLVFGGYVLAGGGTVVWCLWGFVVLSVFACVVLLMPLCCAAGVVFGRFG